MECLFNVDRVLIVILSIKENRKKERRIGIWKRYGEGWGWGKFGLFYFFL